MAIPYKSDWKRNSTTRLHGSSEIPLAKCDHTFRFNIPTPAGHGVRLQRHTTIPKPAPGETTRCPPPVSIGLALNECGRQLGIGKIYHTTLQDHAATSTRSVCPLLYVRCIWSERDKKDFDNATPMKRIAMYTADSILSPNEPILPVEALDRADCVSIKKEVRRESRAISGWNHLIILYDQYPYMEWLSDWTSRNVASTKSLIEERERLAVRLKEGVMLSRRLDDNFAVMERLSKLWKEAKPGQLRFYREVVERQMVPVPTKDGNVTTKDGLDEDGLDEDGLDEDGQEES